MEQEREHLRLLALGHYIFGALLGVGALAPGLYLLLGWAFLAGWLNSPGAPPPDIGWLFVILGGVLVVVGLALALCVLVAGRNLARQRHYRFCLAVAIITCLFPPIGTVLGILTLLMLVRPSVQQLFGVAP